MNIKKISEKNNVAEILVKNADITLMNSIRRAVINSLPSFAADEIMIYDNNSIMFDEFLAHRIGLIPLKADTKKYKLGDKVRLILEKEGPGIVYSKDIKSTDPKIDVVDKRVPIVKLKKGQKVKLEIDAVLGLGKEHAKWQPAIISYRQLPVITALKEVPNGKEIVEACPTHVLEMRAKKVTLVDPVNCILCGKCRDMAGSENLSIEYSDDSFVLTVEPQTGQKTQEMLLLATDSLKDKVKEFNKEIKKFK